MDRPGPGFLDRGLQSQATANPEDSRGGGRVRGLGHDRETRGEEPRKIRSHPRGGSISDGATWTTEETGRGRWRGIGGGWKREGGAESKVG